MRDIRVAILIPAYNASKTIYETLASLQACRDFEKIAAVILLDDCSRDDTAEVAASSWRSGIAFEIRSNDTNKGERTTVNSAFSRLPDDIEWAFILHADDVAKPNWISLYLDEITNCSDDVASICSSYDVWYPETGQIVPGEEYPDRPTVHVPGTVQAVVNTLERGCWWHVSGCAVRVSAFRQIGGFEPNMPQVGDWEWLLRCLTKGFSILYLPRSTMLYRQHAGSVSSTSFREGRDLQEKLQVFAAYRDLGYLSIADYRKKIIRLVYQIARRTLVRAMRCDPMGARCHAALLAGTLKKYVLRQL